MSDESKERGCGHGYGRRQDCNVCFGFDRVRHRGIEWALGQVKQGQQVTGGSLSRDEFLFCVAVGEAVTLALPGLKHDAAPVVMVSSPDAWARPWSPSQADVFATDWRRR